MNPHLTAYGHGIYAIDSGFGRPRLDAVHVVVHEGRAAPATASASSSELDVGERRHSTWAARS